MVVKTVPLTISERPVTIQRKFVYMNRERTGIEGRMEGIHEHVHPKTQLVIKSSPFIDTIAISLSIPLLLAEILMSVIGFSTSYMLQ